MDKYINELLSRHPELEACAESIRQTTVAMIDCFRAGGKVLICGNGGSAADAEHWSGELLKGFEKKRPLSARSREGLRPELAACLQESLPVIPLTNFASLTTAFGNDVDFEMVFAQLTLGLGKPGDVLIGISTSGNSKNVLAAFEVARARGISRIAMTGASGGKLLDTADISIRVPEEKAHLVQELHLPIYHCISIIIEQKMFA